MSLGRQQCKTGLGGGLGPRQLGKGGKAQLSNQSTDVPVARVLDFGDVLVLPRVGVGAMLFVVMVVRLAVVVVHVDLVSAGATEAVSLVDADLFLVARVAAVRVRRLTGGGEGLVVLLLLVTFPSDVRSLSREVGLLLYLDLC